MAQEQQHRVDGLAHVDGLELAFIQAREGAQLDHKFAHALEALASIDHARPRLVQARAHVGHQAFGGFLQHVPQPRLDGEDVGQRKGQRIVDLVRDARHQLTQRGHFFRLDQMHLGFAQLGVGLLQFGIGARQPLRQGGAGLGRLLLRLGAQGLHLAQAEFLDDALILLQQELTPQQRAQAGAQHAHLGGLADEVVGAGLERAGDVLLVLVGRQHQHHQRRVAVAAQGRQLLAHGDAVHVGHHHVHHHAVVIAFRQTAQPLGAAGDLHHLAAFLAQFLRQGLAIGAAVVDDQHAGAAEQRARHIQHRGILARLAQQVVHAQQ